MGFFRDVLILLGSGVLAAGFVMACLAVAGHGPKAAAAVLSLCVTALRSGRDWLVAVIDHYVFGRRFNDSVAREQMEAEFRIDDAHRRARHAMNDAADQSWRNLAG